MSRFEEMTVVTLKTLAKTRGLKGYSKMTKSELIQLLSSDEESKNNDGHVRPLIVDDTGFINKDGNTVLTVSPLCIEKQNTLSDDLERYAEIADGVIGENVIIDVSDALIDMQPTRPETEVDQLVELVAPKKTHNRYNRAMRRRLAARFRKGLIKKPEFMA